MHGSLVGTEIGAHVAQLFRLHNIVTRRRRGPNTDRKFKPRIVATGFRIEFYSLLYPVAVRTRNSDRGLLMYSGNFSGIWSENG